MLLLQSKARHFVLISLLLICLTALSVWLPSYKVQFITEARATEKHKQPKTSNDKLRELQTERYDTHRMEESEKKRNNPH